MTDLALSRSAAAIELLRWIAQRPQLLPGARIDLTRCASCRRTPTALAVLGSPGGAYALCLRCLGQDGLPRPPTPSIPQRR